MMDPMEEKLLRYPDLSDEEREAVDAHVEAHPELAELREEVLRLYALSDEAGAFERDAVTDEAVAYYALTQYLAGQEPTPALAELNNRLEQKIAASPEARERLDAMDRRLRELESGEDVGRHFEQVTGLRLEASASNRSGFVREEEVPYAAGEARMHTLSASERERDARAPAQRPPARIYSLRAMRFAAAAVVVLALGYVALWGASEATEPEWEDLAALSAEELSVEGYNLRLRGSGADSTSPRLRYLRALDLLEQARRTTLGLFPRYDETMLKRASQLLREVIQSEPENSFLQLESYYFLGKAQLALGSQQAAAEAFRAVVEGKGRKAGEAARILRELE